MEFKRESPIFSLCGLNCGLCPRYQTDAPSKCPGCGGDKFSAKHPTCAVITCNQKHDQIEFCFQCSSYPCARFAQSSPVDSFITYRNVLSDMKKAQECGLEPYLEELKAKMKMLEKLLADYNDGRRKSFYCLAVNLLPLSALQAIWSELDSHENRPDLSPKEKAAILTDLFQKHAVRHNLELKLCK